MDVPDLSKSKVVDDLLDNSPTSLDELEELHIYKILIIIASYIAMGVGVLHFVLSMGSMPFGSLIFKLIINLVFGFFLLVSFHNIEDDKIKWSIMTILFSIVLIVFGGVVGLLAGTFSLFGILLSFIYD